MTQPDLNKVTHNNNTADNFNTATNRTGNDLTAQANPSSTKKKFLDYRIIPLWLFYWVTYLYLKWASGYGAISPLEVNEYLGLSTTVWMPAAGLVFGVMYARSTINVIPFILAEFTWQNVTGSPGAPSFDTTPLHIAKQIFVLVFPAALFGTLFRKFAAHTDEVYPGNALLRTFLLGAIATVPFYVTSLLFLSGLQVSRDEFAITIVSTVIAFMLGVFLIAPLAFVMTIILHPDGTHRKNIYRSYSIENYQRALIPVLIAATFIVIASFIEFTQSINIFPLLIIPSAVMLLRSQRAYDLFYFLTPVAIAIVIAFATLNQLNFGDLPIYQIPTIQILLISLTAFCLSIFYILTEARSRQILTAASRVTQREILNAVDQASVGYLITDAAGVVLFASQKCASMMGFTSADTIINRTWKTLDNPNEGLLAKRSYEWENLIARGAAWQGTISWIPDGNNKRYFEANVSQVEDNKYVVVLNDKTDKIISDQNLIASEQLRNFILDSLPLAVVLQDLDNRILYVNDYLPSRADISVQTAIGVKPTAIKEFGRNETLDRMLAKVKETGLAMESQSIKIDTGFFAGTEWLTYIVPVNDHKDTMKQVLTIAMDRTERSKLLREKELITKRLYETQKIEALNKFAGGLAHELSNLLHPAGVYARAMNENPDMEDREKYLTRINEAVLTSGEILKRTLSMARSEGFELTPHDIEPLVHDIIENANAVSHRTINYEYKTDGIQAMCMMDKTEMQQVILNLLINAADAQNNAGTIYVSLICEEEPPTDLQNEIAGPYAKLTVRDTGKGMDAETKASIFDAFFTTKEPGKGTGLGLAVVQGIINGWGGFITVETELNNGTSFHIWIPAALHDGTSPTEDKNLRLENKNTLPEWSH